ncbi:MAG: SDR family NAD(P)-dependent oxidoreductase [Actinomycetota bacterium]|nr:SDR family NAD(P)-dependent oxidoreductase [Actinomycetota bacterium]
MADRPHRAVAIVGVGAILPDAPDTDAFWRNVTEGRCSITDVTADRWDPALYYDPDRQAPERTYSKIGGWVRDWTWDPLAWRLPVPPKVSDAMDRTQQWSVGAARQALVDYGYPDRPLDAERTAVVLGNAMAGDQHYRTALRVFTAEYLDELAKAPSFSALDEPVRRAILDELRAGAGRRFPDISEDTMPGELANIIAGRVANLFDLHGPNFIVDAACASAMAAVDAAIEGLEEGDYDAVLTGGVDANMSASSFVKFCKIGALSATGTRPYGKGADGFVMGEGAAVFLLKRLADAEADGDHVYAVIRGIGGASDGRGKGITAPNPVGQQLAIERGWHDAGLAPDEATYIEGHGTSTKVGDVVEVESLSTVFAGLGLAPGTLPLGSVKSNIGHLKGAAGAAGMLKAALALDRKVLPPSIGVGEPNPNIDFERSPLYVHTELAEWKVTPGRVRAAGVSAFGFGGTNFHVVMEEYVPGRIRPERAAATVAVGRPDERPTEPKAPLRGATVVGGATDEEVLGRLEELRADAEAGRVPPPAAPAEADLRAAVRVAIDHGDAAELAAKAAKAHQALASRNDAAWKLLRNQGVFCGRGEPHQVAFLFTGQGSQYVNMLAGLRRSEPIVARVFDDADRVMTPILGRPLSEVIFADPDDEAAMAASNEELRQTAITQPAVLATDLALTELLGAYGIRPDMVMGHSLGEYAALVAAGALPFAHALEAVAARGREMTRVSVDDNGLMAAVFAPLDEIEATLAEVDGYVVIANINSGTQAVIGGASPAVEAAMERLSGAGHQVVQLPVSHAFHTEIVAPASGPLQEVLARLDLRPPELPVVANVDGELYPMGPAVVPEMIDILGRQIASPVQFVRGLRTLHDAGVRTFVETGPKKALCGFVDDVLGDDPEVVSLGANHPKAGDLVSFNQALCGLYAAGHGIGRDASGAASTNGSVAARPSAPATSTPVTTGDGRAATPVAVAPTAPTTAPVTSPDGDTRYLELGRLVADLLERGQQLASASSSLATAPSPRAVGRGGGDEEPVVVTGAALGLPGVGRPFDDANIGRILAGESFIDVIPVGLRNAMVDHHVTRLVKNAAGGGSFETIDSAEEVIKLAGRMGPLDLAAEYGFGAERVEAFDRTTELAIAAGIDALRDAGIPLVRHYKTTTTGSRLPDRWELPPAIGDRTGVIFASAFPGYDRLVDEVTRFEQDRARQQRLDDLRHLRARVADTDPSAAELDHMIHTVGAEIHADPYTFDRRFLFQALSMGHAQFAEHIGARGPNTQVNAACASTTQAVAIAEDWIRLGRCDRVVVIAADDVTSDALLPWIGTGFLATGAAATDGVVEEAALPFDRRRHGMIVGAGAAALVVEGRAAARARGLDPICELLSSATANSAFHGSRLDVDHIRHVMEDLVADAERRWGVDRRELARQLVFVSHETYTPARGGSAQAEVDALRHVFGADADAIVVANTKGFTGHAMGAGIEDVVAVKALETGIVPPIANVREIDPDLGTLNLSKGGRYPVRYALRLGAGFGSQISMSLLRWVPTVDGARPEPDRLGFRNRIADRGAWAAWLRDLSGYDDPDVEVVQRTFRVRDAGPGAATAAQPTATRPVVAPAAPAPDRPQPAPAMAQPRVAETVPAAPAAAVPTPAPEPVTPAAAVAPVGEAAPAPVGEDPVVTTVLAVVAEQTGYPPEMLDLELDLEADLGIDTVKQAETFAAIRAEYGIERDDSLSLRDYPTLASVVGFVRERATGLAPAPTAAAAVPPALAARTDVASPAPGPEVAPAPVGEDPVVTTVLAVVAEQTGYPPEMLDLELDLEADLGIDTVKQAETFAAIRAEYGIERDDSLSLRDYPTLASVVGFVRERATGLEPAPAPTAAAAAPAPVATAPVAAAPAAPVAAPTPAADGEDPVVAKVLAVVAEQTGYPPEMLDLELDLEADLGIDTVKQAETFAAIRGEYGIERDDSLSLRDYPTLASVVGFVHERATGLAPTPAPAASQAAPPAAESTPAADGEDPVVAKVLAVVAEQTGYPPEMLDLELDLEADLGIDTVKQAETFAAIRAEYGIERDDTLSLRDYPTLGSVVGFVHERGAVPDSSAVPTAEPSSTTMPATADRPVGTAPTPLLRGDDDASAAVARRLAVSVLRPDLELCAPTGVEVGAGSRVLVMGDRGGVGAALVRQLEALGADVLVIDDTPDADDLLRRVDEWRSAGDGAVQGVYWLPALDVEPPLAELDLDGWREQLRVRAKLLYRTLRHLYDDLSTADRFVVAATRLGGRHGYDDAGAVAPMGGAVVGLAKTFKRERPDVLVKAVDFAPSRKTTALAKVLLEETRRDPGVVEVGHRDDQRFTVTLEERPLPDEPGGIELGPDTVFVVTGAAGSIVSAIIADLARASGGVFHLLDLAPEPDPADPDIAAFAGDREGLKRTIFERLKASGERATPALVEKELAGIERRAMARWAIEEVEAAGGSVHYHRVDLRDRDAMAEATAAIVGTSGRVDVLVHAGGLEISRLLPDKEPAEFDLVFDVKADGWFNLLAGFGDQPIGATVVFSSIAGRYGNGGQADYSAANDLLCTWTSSFATTRPDTIGLAVDWTAWGDIGMATRGSIPTVMAAAGIDMLPAAAGIPVLRRELTGDAGTRELLVGGRLGVLTEEWHPAGGLDDGALAEAIAPDRNVVISNVTRFGADGLEVTATLDPTAEPFLDHHRIDGTPVLPGVMGMETFAEVARLLHPERTVTALEDVDFLAPCKFYRDEPRELRLTARFVPDGDDVVATCRLIGERMLANQPEPQVTTHFTGRVRLSPRPLDAAHRDAPGAPTDHPVTAGDVYAIYFHGPAYQVVDRVWSLPDTDGGAAVAGLLADPLPPDHHAGADTVLDPRLIELCFQTAGVWEMATTGAMALPTHIDRVTVRARRRDATDPVVALAHPVGGPDDDAADEGAAGFESDVVVVDADGTVLVELDGYRTARLPGQLDDDVLAPLRAGLGTAGDGRARR